MLQEISKAVAPTTLSVSSTVVSFFATTLPVVQWMAAAVAVASGLVAIVWVIVQIRDRLRRGKSNSQAGGP